jgi:ribose/xylose/arabinose/galactoside ABC-type transport system permease subunit
VLVGVDTILAAVLGGVDPFGRFRTVTGLMLALAILQVVSADEQHELRPGAGPRR